ncbi:MAG: FG-GAP repeat domain-containing protein, partial [Planctomycetota bacterium]
KPSSDPNTPAWQTRKKIKIDDGLETISSLICADLNNDGADDIALAARNNIYIILQKDDATLAEPIKYPTTSLTLGLEIADLNGDNINDLVIITNDKDKPVHVRFGLSTGQFGPQEKFHIERPAALEISNIDSIPGDEILTVDAQSRRLSAYTLSNLADENSDWPMLFYPLTAGKANLGRDMVIGDFDGDKLSDIIVSDQTAAEIIFYRQLPELGLAEPVRFPSLADITSLSAADIDKNGKSELCVLSVKEKLIALSKYTQERFSFPQSIDLLGEPLAAELTDIDKNKKTDCVYISKDANDLRSLNVIYNLAKTIKSDSKNQKHAVLELKKLTSNPDAITVMDLDQDGLKDVLIFVKYEKPILIRQTKKKKFELIDIPSAQASLIKDASIQSIASADIDGDNKAELLLAQNNFARSLVFNESKKWSVVDQYNARGRDNKISAVAAFDLDCHDSSDQPDILLLDSQRGQLQILKPGSDKTYRFDKAVDVGKWNAASKLKMRFESLTGSDIKNILLFDNEKFAIITPPDGHDTARKMQQMFTYETKIKDGVYGHLTLGDINQDRKTDLIMVEYNRNHIEILAIDSNTKPTPAMRFKVFEQKSYRDKKRSRSSVEPRELKVDDVTNDGKNDLVTIIHDRIIIYPQD